MSNYKYEYIQGKWCNEEILNNCAQLFSNHYGTWSNSNPYNLSGNIKLSSNRIKKLLNIDDTDLYYAIDVDTNQMVGYAIALRKNIKRLGVFSWVTQLVVHKDHQHKGIATNLLFSIWGLSNDYAWGIVTSNPYAVRALEKATRRRSIPLMIKKKIDKIISVGAENVDYINERIEYIVDNNNSKVNTDFYVDHSQIAEKLMNVISEDIPWLLGELDEGWEWAAFTFNNQPQISLTQTEIQNMLNTSDDVVKLAYSRMNITGEHSWTKYTKNEAEYIISNSDIKKGQKIIDFGCGIGRHSIALSDSGYDVTAIDYIEKNIDNIKKYHKNINAITGDCRTIELNEQADVVLCLYDVIGSFSETDDNMSILKNIYKHLKRGGIAFISVMNFELTDHIAKNKFTIASDPDALLQLPAGNIMETNGDVFKPDLLLVDENDGLVYRKEQFTAGRELPIELIVRDKRFTMEEIKGMCISAGFTVENASYVSAKNWNEPLYATDPHAKEILLKCVKK